MYTTHCLPCVCSHCILSLLCNICTKLQTLGELHLHLNIHIHSSYKEAKLMPPPAFLGKCTCSYASYEPNYLYLVLKFPYNIWRSQHHLLLVSLRNGFGCLRVSGHFFVLLTFHDTSSSNFPSAGSQL